MIEAIDGLDAWTIAADNQLARYPVVGKGDERLLPYAAPAPNPSFSIARTDKVFTIGSCFAREVDKAMVRAGIDVISRTPLPEHLKVKSADSLFNKYTAHSMLNEIKWALDPNSPPPGDEGFVEVGNGLYNDMQLGGRGLALDIESIREVRASFTKAMTAVREADVFIATLGLAETWYDKHLGVYLNASPTRSVCEKYPGRFEFRVLDYEEIYSAIVEIYETVKRFGKPNVKFLFTVSPVALLATFRKQDVLVANTYSKAVQRAALERFVKERDDVDYFPSFESVMLSPSTTAWSGSDFRHVNTYLVRRIMGSVLSAYMGEHVVLNTPDDEIKMLYRNGQYDEAIAYGAGFSADALDWRSHYYLALSRKNKKQWAEAFEIFNTLKKIQPANKSIAKNVVMCAYKIRHKSIRQIMIDYNKAFPEGPDVNE